MKLELRHLSGGYGAKEILHDISLDLPDHSVVTLLGANGSGKSTLLKLIGRLLKPQAGCVLLDGRDVHTMKTAELARQMAILPQIHQAPGEITVEELVAFGRFPHRKTQFANSSHDRRIIEQAIEMTHLEELRKRNLSNLSGGERQRAWIAMTLAQEPQILLLDEPTTYLDVCCQFEIIDLVRDLNRRCKIMVVMVLHDLNLAARYSDLLVTLKDRQIRNIGTPHEIMTPEILREIFQVDCEIFTGSDGIPYCVPLKSARTPLHWNSQTEVRA